MVSTAGCFGDVEELPEYQGRSYEAVVAELGSPDLVGSFVVNDTSSLYEYQGGLHRFQQGREPLEVQEVSWKQPRNQLLVVWFERQGNQWVGLEGLRWDTLAMQF